MKLVDLHTHTRASDGTDSPAQLMAKAAEADLKAIAITDHDTLAGLDEAAVAGRELGVELIRGCEVSTSTERGELHILGLWLPEQPEALLQELALLREKRGIRNEGIVRKLQDLGLDICMEEVLAAAKGESVGRPHIADVLLRKGYAKDIREVFKEYLGNYGKAYLPKEVLEPQRIVRLLSDLGATVSLAHPLLWKGPPGWLEAQVAHLKDCGLNAIEAWHSEHSEADVRTCLALAKRFDLGISGGSDYHGTNKPAIQLGRGYGGLRVGESVLDDLRARRIRMGLPA